MEEFLIIDNNNIFRKIYLKLFVLIKFEKSMNIKLKLKKEKIKNSIEKNMMKEGEVKEEEVKEEEVKEEEVKEEEVKEEKIKEVEEVKKEIGKNECVKNLKHSEVIDIRVNGNLEPLNVKDDNIEEDKDDIYEEKLNTGLKDVDVGCSICCRGCKNIFAYICFNLKKCSNYIMNKCNDNMNNN